MRCQFVSTTSLFVGLLLSMFATLVTSFPLRESISARLTHPNLAPQRTLPLSQPSSDLNPLVLLADTPLPPAYELLQTPASVASQTVDETRLEPNRSYARQARYFESPNQRLARRRREKRLFEYLA